MSNKKMALLIVSAVLLITFIIALALFVSSQSRSNQVNDNTGQDEVDDEPNNEVEKDVAPYNLKSAKGVELIVNSPEDKSSVGCPINIKGSITGAWYFEAIFGIKILDGNGKELASGIATATEDWMTEEKVEFESVIDCDDCSTARQIEFIKDNPSGLSEFDDKITLDIITNLSCNMKSANGNGKDDTETTQVKVFFQNSIKDPVSTDCSNTFSVNREVSKTLAVGKASINELLKGPSAAEAGEGYNTQIPDGVILKSIDIRNGIAYVDFNNKLQDGVAGSCRVIAIRAQIEDTLKQFSTVSDVVISINGNSEDVLQP
jgi:hypothetical protein